MGYTSKYITIKGDPYSSLTNLLREHILKTKSNIDKFVSVLNKIKYYFEQSEEITAGFMTSKGNALSKLVIKHGMTLARNPIKWPDDLFSEWQDIRDTFQYIPVNWKSTNISSDTTVVSYEVINFHDSTSSVMLFYLVDEINKLFELNNSKSMGEMISTIIADIINYIYGLYDTEMFMNSMEYKRFQYILDGSEFLIDPLIKGQGLDKLTAYSETDGDIEELKDELTEEEKDEMTDIKEESEALDIESPEYEDENEDYNEGADYEE